MRWQSSGASSRCAHARTHSPPHVCLHTLTRMHGPPARTRARTHACTPARPHARTRVRTQDLLTDVGLFRMATWDAADGPAGGASGGSPRRGGGGSWRDEGHGGLGAGGRHKRKGGQGGHHMGSGELRAAKRRLREMQSARDRERGKKVRTRKCVCVRACAYMQARRA